MRALRALLLLGLALAATPAAAATSAGSTHLSSEAVTTIAREWLVERLGASASDTAIELVGSPREIVVPATPVSTTVTLQAGSLAGGTVTLLVEAAGEDHAGSRVTRSTTVAFRTNAEQEVVVTTRELPRRSMITAADVRLERRAVERVPRLAVRELRDVVGKEVIRPLGPGEVIPSSAVSAPILVRRGSAVMLLLDGRGFRINARGIASEDGARGQSIRVVNPTSRREVVGTVEDERTVRVAF